MLLHVAPFMHGKVKHSSMSVKLIRQLAEYMLDGCRVKIHFAHMGIGNVDRDALFAKCCCKYIIVTLL